MQFFRLLPLSCLIALVAMPGESAPGADANKSAKAKVAKTYEIPYKTTIPKHIVIRAKINGKGPFNFILDTGAPALFIATKVGDKAGLKGGGAKKWSVIDRFEIEGGLVIEKARGRVETPFQLEGMNGMGLAGLEIHGLIGYDLLARYRMEIDFTRDKMTWTELDYVPKLPAMKGGGGNQGELEMMGTVMKTVGAFMGRKSTPEISLRGFYGMTLVDGDEYPKVTTVLGKGPAGVAGLKVGDLITKLDGRSITNIADVLKRANRIAPGTSVKLTVKRDDKTTEITITTGEGI
jgi:PDZ domain/Aspartyl protease